MRLNTYGEHWLSRYFTFAYLNILTNMAQEAAGGDDMQAIHLARSLAAIVALSNLTGCEKQNQKQSQPPNGNQSEALEAFEPIDFARLSCSLHAAPDSAPAGELDCEIPSHSTNPEIAIPYTSDEWTYGLIKTRYFGEIELNGHNSSSVLHEGIVFTIEMRPADEKKLEAFLSNPFNLAPGYQSIAFSSTTFLSCAFLDLSFVGKPLKIDVWGALKPIDGHVGKLFCGTSKSTTRSIELSKHTWENGFVKTHQFGDIQVIFVKDVPNLSQVEYSYLRDVEAKPPNDLWKVYDPKTMNYSTVPYIIAMTQDQKTRIEAWLNQQSK